MSRTLTPDSTLEGLKKEAKHWLKALRAGDAHARRRLAAALLATPVDPGLRDIQFALAREFGLSGWTALRNRLDELALSQRSQAELVDIVLHSAWQGDIDAARRILARWPDIANANIYTAIVTGNRSEFEGRLASDPEAATRPGGPLNWQPLLYLAYARLPGGDAHAIDVARELLDRGADSNARFDDGWGNPFTILTGIIGEGEGDRPPHPHAAALAALLIDRGANPYDTQSMYNTSITRDDTRWLEFLWLHSEKRGVLDDWLQVPQPKLGGRIPLNALDYLLGNAVAYNHLRRAQWLLAHGADADGVHAYSGRRLREEALIYGHVAMAELLVHHGAQVLPLDAPAAFQAACMRLDRDVASDLARRHPECLHQAEPMLTAARQGRADVVSLLLELGMDVDICDETEQRGIQNAVLGDALDVVKLLVAHGADVDRPTKRFGGAMGFAAHFQRREIAEFLAPLSRDLLDLTALGMLKRLGELLTQDATLANAVHGRFGVTALFCLPDDEDSALETAELLLGFGADPTIRDSNGVTAEQAARQRGLIDVAERMREAAARSEREREPAD